MSGGEEYKNKQRPVPDTDGVGRGREKKTKHFCAYKRQKKSVDTTFI